jgi:hypothetical protein
MLLILKHRGLLMIRFCLQKYLAEAKKFENFLAEVNDIVIDIINGAQDCSSLPPRIRAKFEVRESMFGEIVARFREQERTLETALSSICILGYKEGTGGGID